MKLDLIARAYTMRGYRRQMARRHRDSAARGRWGACISSRFMTRFSTVISRVLRSVLQPGLRLSRDSHGASESMDIGDLRVSCHRDLPTGPEFIRAWDRLLSAQPAAGAFQCHAWQKQVIAQLTSSGSRRLLTVERGNDLLAVLPLQIAGGLLETPGHWLTDYLTPLTRPESIAPCWRGMLQLLSRLWDRRLHSLVLHNIPDDAALLSVLPDAAAGTGFRLSSEVADVLSEIHLPPTWDAWLGMLSPHQRKETLRKLRHAQTLAGASLKVCSEEHEIGLRLETLLGWMQAAGGDKGQATASSIGPLLRAVTPDLAREGRLRLLTLMLHDQPAACLVELTSPRGPMIYNAGFDPAQRTLSPGAVAIALAIRHAIEARAAVFDLLRGREPYKRQLGAVEHNLMRLTLTRA